MFDERNMPMADAYIRAMERMNAIRELLKGVQNCLIRYRETEDVQTII